MILEDIYNTLQESLSTLSIGEGISNLKVLFIFAFALFIYAFFVFKFYKIIGRKNIFNINLQQYAPKEKFKRTAAILLYILEYLILFPLIAGFMFVIFFVLVAFLSKERTTDTILLITIAFVVLVRIVAYYKECLSKDLAKMFPFTLLALFLLDTEYFSINSFSEIIREVPFFAHTIVYYLVALIGTEWIMRIGYTIFSLIKPESIEDKEVDKLSKKVAKESKKIIFKKK